MASSISHIPQSLNNYVITMELNNIMFGATWQVTMKQEIHHRLVLAHMPMIRLECLHHTLETITTVNQEILLILTTTISSFQMTNYGMARSVNMKVTVVIVPTLPHG